MLETIKKIILFVFSYTAFSGGLLLVVIGEINNIEALTIFGLGCLSGFFFTLLDNEKYDD